MGLNHHQREHLGELNHALRALAAQLQLWRPTLPALEAVERALRRIDNTVERALKVDLYAPELDARREAMDAIVTRCAPLVRAMRAPAVSDLEGAVAFLRALLPLAWNASDEETPRWLSANWLLLGTVAFELKRATQAGLVHRLWGHDVLWFERDTRGSRPIAMHTETTLVFSCARFDPPRSRDAQCGAPGRAR